MVEPVPRAIFSWCRLRNVRKSVDFPIPSMIETGTRFGMQSMKAAIDDLVQRDLVDGTVVFRKDNYL